MKFAIILSLSLSLFSLYSCQRDRRDQNREPEDRRSRPNRGREPEERGPGGNPNRGPNDRGPSQENRGPGRGRENDAIAREILRYILLQGSLTSSQIDTLNRNINDEIAVAALEASQDLRNSVNDGILDAYETFEGALEEAQSTSADALSCVEEKRGNIDEVSEQIRQLIEDCTTSSVATESQNITSKLEENSAIIASITESAIQEVQNTCIDGASSRRNVITCSSNIALKTSIRFLEITSQNQEYVLRARALIRNLPAEIRKCTGLNGDTVAERLVQIAEEVDACLYTDDATNTD